MITYGLVILAVAVLFTVFIGFKKDSSLVGALEAAGTVTAAGFAALAALGSMRAAAQSNATARRSREALAQTMRPRIVPILSRENGKVLGTLRCGEGRGALDVTVVWILADRDEVTDRVAHLEPSADFVLDLNLPESANLPEELTMVWVEYWDDSRVGHWQDVWQIGTEPIDQGRLHQTDSRLVD